MSTETAQAEASLTDTETIVQWVIFLVAAIIAAFIIEYGLASDPTAAFAAVMGVATGLAVVIADAIIRLT